MGVSIPSYDYQNQSSEQKQTQVKPNGKEAGKNLARLMERQLGYQEGHIDSVALRLFIRAYWSRVSKYAHDIHDDND